MVRPGLETVQMGKGERIMWLKLASRHYEYLRTDQAEEFKAVRKLHLKEIAPAFKYVLTNATEPEPSFCSQ